MADRLDSELHEERSDTAPVSPYPLPVRSEPGAGSAAADFLRAVPMFAGLSEPLRRKLAARCEPVRLEAGEFLFRQGDAGDGLYVLRSGRLEVVLEPDGDVVRELTHGAVVGELALLTREPRSASVRARRDSELLRVSGTAFAELLAHEPRFSLAMMRELGHQLRASRGLDRPGDPLPATIAVLGTGPADAKRLAADLESALGELGTVALLAGPDLTHAALDRAEREHDRVLLLADDPDAAFALRQADRVLLHATGPPPEHRSPPPGCDVILEGPVDALVAREWVRAGRARAVHWLAHDRGVHALARRLAGRSVGVVLSSGGARGLAHIGVLEELVAAGLGIDRVGGCSMGAFVGAMFAMGMSPEEIHDRCRQEFVVRHPLGDYGIPTHSLLRGERARSMLRRTFSDANIEELPREFFCVSCDLVSGERIVHRSGRLAEAVEASMCLPGVFAPRARDGMLLVDGGVLDSLPVETMAATAEGPVVAVDVGRRFTPPPPRRRPGGRPALPPLKETLARSIVLGSIDTAKRAHARADVVIEPVTGDCGMLDFSRLDEMVAAGRVAAQEPAAYAMLRQHATPALL
jgi:predicted acylesterase/phospholipase RssA